MATPATLVISSKADKNNFGPTVSFAWSPQFGGALGRLFPGDGGTVLRGGYRISYNNNEYVRTPDNAYVQLVGLGSQVLNAFQGGVTTLEVDPDSRVLTCRASLPFLANFATPSLADTADHLSAEQHRAG